MASLDATAQKLLNKDPSNPNSPKKTADAPKPSYGLSRSTMTSSRPSLREAMLAQKKAALASKNLPARPGSAMAHISSPTKPTANTSAHSSAATSARPAAKRGRPDSTLSVNAGGMSVAPMRPVRRRPEVAARPATAGPYSMREHHGLEEHSPEGVRTRHLPLRKDTTPKKALPKTRAGHAPHSSESSIPSPTFRSASKRLTSPRGSPVKPRVESHAQGSPTLAQATAPSATSPSRAGDDVGLVVPKLASLHLSGTDVDRHASPDLSRETTVVATSQDAKAEVPDITETPHVTEVPLETPPRSLKVYEDPFTGYASTTKPAFSPPVLEDKPVNEDAGNLPKANGQAPSAAVQPDSPDKMRQNSRLLDSGIAKIKAKSLEVHGFRKLQSLIRDSKTVLTDDKFEALVLGLFQYLEDPLASQAQEKIQDVKAQILSTIKLLLKKERDNFQPFVSKGLESLLETRGAYDARAHVVSGLELLANELVTLGDGSEITIVLTRRLQSCTDETVEGCRTLSMGLHVLKEMIDQRGEFVPADGELAQLTSLSSRCLDSADSGVRMDAVKFCVSLHDRVGDAEFWDAFKNVKEDPKSVITYYIVKKQRERGLVP